VANLQTFAKRKPPRIVVTHASGGRENQ